MPTVALSRRGGFRRQRDATGAKMVVPAALIALVVLLRGGGETPVPAQ
jgi:hypothetical protein